MEKNYLEIVVEGHDGAAKTPVVKKISEKLQGRGFDVKICAPFTIANAQLSTEGMKDIYQLWVSEAPNDVLKALGLLRSIVEGVREEIRSTFSQTGILIFDRGWMTVLRGLDDVKKQVMDNLKGSPKFVEELGFWMDELPPTIFGIAKPEMTRQTSLWHPDIPWKPEEDYIRRNELLKTYRERVIFSYERTQAKGMDLDKIAEDALLEIFKVLPSK